MLRPRRPLMIAQSTTSLSDGREYGGVHTPVLVSFSILLERLNDDVLERIVHTLLQIEGSGRSMKQLSLTSKHFRFVCLPLLFEKGKIDCNRLDDPALPPASWPFIRILEVKGDFTPAMRRNSRNLQQILPRLVSLRTVRFWWPDYGVRWEDLHYLLSAPNVRVVEIEEQFSAWRSKFTFPKAPSPPVPFPFTELIYTEAKPPSWYEGPRLKDPGPIDKWNYLGLLTFSLHTNLEVLHVPPIMAPLSEMAAVDWPRMQKLELDGDWYSDDLILLSQVCAKMPRLRVLDLHVRHKVLSQTLVWPHDTPSTPSFENMETVFI
ncbi:hypothetical protein EVG20_g10480, partial [Dentipellis fragilis]